MAADPLNATKSPRPDDWYCTATSKRTGNRCGRRAGSGTDHVGVGLCKHHGGVSPGGVVQGQKLNAVKAVQEFGLPREIEPHQALIEELHRAAGWVAWLEAKVSEEGPDVLATTVFPDEGPPATVTSPFYEILTHERKQLVGVAQACIKAGVEERRVRVIEQGAQFAAQAIRAALGNLGLDLESPKVKQAVTQALSVVPAA